MAGDGGGLDEAKGKREGVKGIDLGYILEALLIGGGKRDKIIHKPLDKI